MIVRVFLLQVLVTSLCQAQDFLNVEIPSRSGLHYESIGDVRFTTAEWWLTSYIDLNKFINERPPVNKKLLENMNRKCKFYVEPGQCEAVINSENLLRKNENVDNYIDEFNFLVNKIKSENTDETLRLVRTVEETYLDALIEQPDVDYGNIWNKTNRTLATHVVQTGLHEFHDIINELEKGSTARVRDIEETVKIIVEMEKNEKYPTLEYQRMLDKIRNWAETLEIALDNYIYTIRTIIDAVYLAKTEVTHPPLFSHKKLRAAVEYFIANNQTSSLTFPISIEELYTEKLLKISKTKIVFNGGRLFVILNVPLVAAPVYHLFKMHPYPTLQMFRHKRGSAYIQPKADYLLRTEDFYALAYTEDLVSCQSTDDHHYICGANFPLYNTKARPICEATSFTKDNQQPVLNCNIKLSSSFNSHWTKTGNGWLYSTPEREMINISCDGRCIGTLNISGVGVLQIREGCQAVTSYATMMGFKTKDVTPVNYIDVWNLNVTTLVYNQDCFNSLTKNYVELGEFLGKCDERMLQIKSYSTHFSLLLGGLIVCGLFGVLPWIIFSIVKVKKNCRQTIV